MNKSELQSALSSHHALFISLIDSISEEKLVVNKAEKWSPMQQLDHLCKSVNPLLLAYSLPRFALKLLFGKSTRQSRTYSELVARYNEKLQNGGRATGRFVPPPAISASQKAKLSQKLQKDIETLNHKIQKWKEEDLDNYVIPHPLLGKLTAREMLYFTIYHVQHHSGLIRRDYM